MLETTESLHLEPPFCLGFVHNADHPSLALTSQSSSWSQIIMGHNKHNKKNKSFNVLGNATYAYIHGSPYQDDAESRET